jgi:hypothetical protein
MDDAVRGPKFGDEPERVFVAREPVVVELLDGRPGDAEAARKPAEVGVFLQDGRAYPTPGQLVGGSQAREPSADDGDMAGVSQF